MSISVVIPSTGNLLNLNKLMHSLKKQNGIEACEILLVLNNCDLNKRIKCEELITILPQNLTIHFNDHVGVNAARNYGISHAKNSIILFLDDDCELFDFNFLKKHAEMHIKYSEVTAIGGGYVVTDKSSALDKIYNHRQMAWLFEGIKEKNEASYLLGGNFSVKKNIIVSGNLYFDENIIYGGSELDFFRKLEIAGFKNSYIDLDVIHNTDENLYTVIKKIYLQGRGKAYIDFKLGTKLESTVIKPYFFDKGVSNKLLDYFFWLGYYSYQGKKYRVILHLFKEIYKLVSKSRYEALDSIDKKIKLKKEDGDRF